MKKSILIALTFVTINTHQLYPMDMLKTVPTVLYDYFKTCDPYKTALVATISLLVIDRIYPIFPQLKRIQHPITTHDLTFLKSNFLVNMEGYSKDVLAPAIDERINILNKSIVNTYVSQHAFNEYLEKNFSPTIAAIGARFDTSVTHQIFNEKTDYLEQAIERSTKRINEIATEKPHLAFSLPKDSSDLYEVAAFSEVENKLKADNLGIEKRLKKCIEKKVKKMKQTINEFKSACLSTMAGHSLGNIDFSGFSFNDFNSEPGTPSSNTPRLDASLTLQSKGSFSNLHETLQESPRGNETDGNESDDDDADEIIIKGGETSDNNL